MRFSKYFRGFVSSRWGLTLLFILYIVLCFSLGIDRNRILLAFTLSAVAVGIYLTPGPALKILVFAMGIFIITNSLPLPHYDILEEVLNRHLPSMRHYRPVSGNNSNKYVFYIPDYKGKTLDSTCRLIIEGERLKNMSYSITGAETISKSDIKSTSNFDDEAFSIALKISSQRVNLAITALPGTTFQLWQGTEVHRRKIYPDAIYLIMENSDKRIICYPEYIKP